MSQIEIQKIQFALMSIQKKVDELEGATGAVALPDVQKEVQAAYLRLMVHVDSSLAEIKTRLDDLSGRIEKMEAVPKMVKATEILARLDKLEALAAAAEPAPVDA